MPEEHVAAALLKDGKQGSFVPAEDADHFFVDLCGHLNVPIPSAWNPSAS